MALLDRFFKRKPQAVAASATPVELLSGNAAFTQWGGNAYENDTYRAAVDAIARNAAKLKGCHIIETGEVKKPATDKVNRLLQVQPNRYMNAYDMLYKVVTHYFLYNNGFLLIQRDGAEIQGIYPLNPTQVDFLTDAAGNLYARFQFRNGSQFIADYRDVIHLRRNFNSNDLLGDDNAALYPALELADTQNQGIVNGIKAGANIRGIIHFTQIMAPEKLKAEKEAFVADYLNITNDGGVVATDQKMEYTPIDSKPATIDAEQLKAVKTKIYDYLGVSESIVNSSYTENEWASFYESTIEPVALQLGLEFTRKLFTEREIAFGNTIIFESSRLQFSSNATKVSLIKELMPYGLLTVNECREILNLAAIPDADGGNKRFQTLNVVDADKANTYQVGQDGGGDSGTQDN